MSSCHSILLICWLIVPIVCFGQNSPDHFLSPSDTIKPSSTKTNLSAPLVNQINIIPPSPISKEFEKYIMFEVSLANGIPEITIPLYQIQLKGLTIPVELSYHASGIKFEQETGDFGLGWVLNPGYRIARTVLGYADEDKSMPADIQNLLNTYENNAITPQGKLERDKFLAQFVEDDPFSSLSPQVLDSEFDHFTFSLPSSSGGFIISDRINKTITTNEASNLKINYKTGNGSICSGVVGIIGFQVIDPQGVKFSYGEYDSQTTCSIERRTQVPAGGNTAVAWGLAKILTPVGEEVNFNYTTRTVGGIGSSANLTIEEAFPTVGISTSNISTAYNFNNYYSTFFPSVITTPNEKIIFTRISDSDNRISNIQIFTSDEKILKKINFYYHSGLYNGYFPSTYFLLDSLVVLDAAGNQKAEKYRFEYYTAPPGQYSFRADQCGYCVPGDPSLYFHDSFKNDSFYIREQPDPLSPGVLPLIPLSYIADKFLKRETISDIPNILSLKRITYPTGGFTEYEYEKNSYSIVEPQQTRTESSGIRIGRIVNSDLLKNEILIKTYKYGFGESGYGNANLFIDRNLFVSENLKLDRNNSENIAFPGYIKRIITYSSQMQGDAGSIVGHSSFVSYPTVTEYFSSSLSGNGKIIYNFDLEETYNLGSLDHKNDIPRGNYQAFPIYIKEYKPWNKPLLLSKNIYNNANQLVRSESYQYEKSSSSFTGLKVLQSAEVVPDYPPNADCYYAPWNNYFLKSFFNYSLYTYEIGKTELKGKFIIDYSNGQSLINEYSYDYSHLLPSKETVKRSTGDYLVSYTLYPLDYPAGTPFIDDMKSNNLIAFPVEKVEYFDNGTNKTVVTGIVTKYKAGGKGLQDSKWLWESTLPTSSEAFKFSNRALGIVPPSGSSTSFQPDNLYSRKLTFDNYDSMGNLLQLHKENDINTYYLWAYNKQYPIAKIETAVNTTINITVDDSQLKKTAVLSDIQSDVNYLKGLLNAYVANKDYIVSIYTFKPLVGMTSQTDPAGRTIYYEYDTFNRLKLSRDQNGNVIEKYDYHYANQ